MKSKLEKDFWRLLKPHFVPGHITRVENGVGTGDPDLDICVNGLCYRVELKAPSTKTYKLLDIILPSQKIWHMRRVENGGVVFVMVLCGSIVDLYICRGYEIYEKLESVVIQRHTTKLNYQFLKDTMTRTAKRIILSQLL